MKRTNTTVPTWITVAEAAERTSLAVVTIRRMIDRGTLPAYRAPGVRSLRIKVTDVDALMTEVNPSGRALHQEGAA